MRRSKKVLSIALSLVLIAALMAGIMPSAAAYTLEPSGPHVLSIGNPPYNADSVTRAAEALALDSAYSAGNMMKAQFDADIAAGGTSFYMDRLLARTGSSTSNGNNLPFTRGRALYMTGHTPGTMGWLGNTSYMRPTGPNNLFSISSNVAVTETNSSRVNAPGYYSNTFASTAANLTVEQRKFITQNNVAVSLLTFSNAGTADRNITLTVTSNAATTPVGTTELRSTRKAPIVITDLTYRLAGAGFTVNGTNLRRTITVPAGGTFDVSVVCGVTAAEIPESNQEFETYLSLSNDAAFKKQMADYHSYWYTECPYVETPSTPINKAVAYRWWLSRYNSLDANVPGHAFQYPVTIEGVQGYNNTIVLTQGMHMQDTNWLRTGTLAYGGLLNVGNLSYSSAYLDSQGTITATTPTSAAANWNQHYSNYIASAGLDIYKVHGGGKEVANTLAYHFAGDAQGQLDHFRSDANSYLIGYNWNSMAGNDADAISFSYPKTGTSWIERPESAYVYAAANAASELYSMMGDAGKAAELQTLAGKISTDIQNRLWCDACGTFECAVRNGGTINNKHNGTQLIRVKEGNLYDIYAEYSVPKTDGTDNFVDGLRYLTYNAQYPIFPYYTSNQADRSIQGGGSNNFSNINFTVLVRAYMASLRYYDVQQQYVTSQMLSSIIDWAAFNLYPAGNLDMPDNNEYFYSYSSPTSYSRSGIHHDTLGSYTWLMFEAMGGIVPRADDAIELWPVDLGYDHFLLNNVRYHDADLTLVWDKPGDGTTYFNNVYGEGFSLYVNGVKKVTMDGLRHFTYNPNTNEVAFPANGDQANPATAANVTFKAATGATLSTAVNTKLYDERVIDNFQYSGINMKSDAVNLALGATATASFTQVGARSTPWNGNHSTARSASVTNHEPLASPAAAINGVTVNAPFWGNYGSTNSHDWLEVDFGAAKTFDNVKLYFYNDLHDGGYREPLSYVIQYYGQDSQWHMAENQNKTPLSPRSNYNDVLFKEVTASKVRVRVANQPTYYTAISEMQVFSSGKIASVVTNTAPSVTLSLTQGATIYSANLIGLVRDDCLPNDELTLNWEVVKKPMGAQVSFADANKALTTVNCSVLGDYTFKLSASDGELSATGTIDFTVALPTGDDIAPAATVSSSYCASWENQNRVNDITNNPSSSNPGTGRSWGNWSNGASAANPAWLKLTWGTEQDQINKVQIYWYSDGGGTMPPSATGWKLQYSNDNTTWNDVTLTGSGTYANTLTLGTYNTLTFAPVTTRYLRIYITSIQNNAAGTGVVRFKAFGNSLLGTEPVFVRTVAGVIPTLPAKVLGYYATGNKIVDVTWDAITAAQVAETQQDPILVQGTVAGTNTKANAYVYVRPDMDITINAIDPVSASTMYGVQPTGLPASVKVLYNDGAVDNQTIKVAWPAVDWTKVIEGANVIKGNLTLPSYVDNTQDAILNLTVTHNSDASVYVSAIAVDPAGPLGLAETAQMTATVTPETAANKNLIWTSDNTDVATISDTGLVTIVGFGSGTASFKVKSADPNGFTQAFTIPLKGKATRIALGTSVVSLKRGRTLDLGSMLQYTPAAPFDKSVTYSSLNTTVATVSADGIITGLKAGMTLVMVRSIEGVTTQVAVTVVS